MKCFYVFIQKCESCCTGALMCRWGKRHHPVSLRVEAMKLCLYRFLMLSLYLWTVFRFVMWHRGSFYYCVTLWYGVGRKCKAGKLQNNFFYFFFKFLYSGAVELYSSPLYTCICFKRKLTCTQLILYHSPESQIRDYCCSRYSAAKPFFFFLSF